MRGGEISVASSFSRFWPKPSEQNSPMQRPPTVLSQSVVLALHTPPMIAGWFMSLSLSLSLFLSFDGK